MSSLLAEPERHELRPAAFAATLGRTVVVAPHADDESLACGGLLALLARAGVEAAVVVVTDGAASHPGSRAFPPERLRAQREAEAREAVRVLGHGGRVYLLGLPDGAVPAPASDAFAEAAGRLAALLAEIGPETVVAPWRRDPHPDHEAAWHLAWSVRDPSARWIEAPVWAWHRGGDRAAPQDHEATAWRLDVSSVLDVKAAAVAAHASQTTGLIADSPAGFVLTPDLLAPFRRPYELYLDPTDA